MYNNDIYPALQTFGIERLRKEQERALTPILAGRDVLVRLRTGGGKSLLYQLPTLLDEPGSLTLVFSPLRALQRDQVQALERRGVHAALLNSDLSTSMHADILRDFAVNGGLLYLAPEQLRRALQAVGLLEPEPRGILNDRLALRASRRHGQHGDQIRNLGGVDADTAQCAPSDRDARAGYLGLRAEAAQNVQNGAVALRGRQAQSLHAHAAL